MFSHTAHRGHIARTVAATIVATTFGVQASHAQVAAKDGDVPSVAVKYDDLNLATVEGSRVLYHRLEAAAEQVCPKVGYVTELRQNQNAKRCIAASVERAVKQIRSPQLAQVAAAKMR